MSNEYEEKLGIPVNHSLRFISSEVSRKRGQDTDIYIYEELDDTGTSICRYEIRDSTSIYPPQRRTITHKKISWGSKLIYTSVLIIRLHWAVGATFKALSFPLLDCHLPGQSAPSSLQQSFINYAHCNWMPVSGSALFSPKYRDTVFPASLAT